jgi:hypothetical protein
MYISKIGYQDENLRKKMTSFLVVENWRLHAVSPDLTTSAAVHLSGKQYGCPHRSGSRLL